MAQSLLPHEVPRLSAIATVPAPDLVTHFELRVFEKQRVPLIEAKPVAASVAVPAAADESKGDNVTLDANAVQPHSREKPAAPQPAPATAASPSEPNAFGTSTNSAGLFDPFCGHSMFRPMGPRGWRHRH